jgi:hypothetical protein
LGRKPCARPPSSSRGTAETALAGSKPAALPTARRDFAYLEHQPCSDRIPPLRFGHGWCSRRMSSIRSEHGWCSRRMSGIRSEHGWCPLRVPRHSIQARLVLPEDVGHPIRARLVLSTDANLPHRATRVLRVSLLPALRGLARRKNLSSLGTSLQTHRASEDPGYAGALRGHDQRGFCHARAEASPLLKQGRVQRLHDRLRRRTSRVRQKACARLPRSQGARRERDEARTSPFAPT